MPYNVNAVRIDHVSVKIDGALVNTYRHLILAQQGVNATPPDYRELLKLPSFNLTLQNEVAIFLASGSKEELLTYLSGQRGQTITEDDISNYYAAFNQLASDIETNIALFLPSLNPTTKQLEFDTPVAAGVKTTINNRITNVLAQVS